MGKRIFAPELDHPSIRDNVPLRDLLRRIIEFAQRQPDLPGDVTNIVAEASGGGGGAEAFILGLPGRVLLGNPGLWNSFHWAGPMDTISIWTPTVWDSGTLEIIVFHKRWSAGVKTIVQALPLSIAAGDTEASIPGSSLIARLPYDWIEYEVTGSVPAGCSDLEVRVRCNA